MKKSILLLFIVLVFLSYSKAQDTNKIHYRITTAPIQYFFKDFPFTFEKVWKKHTIGLTLSYRPSTKNGGEVKSIGSGLIAGEYTAQNFWNPLYNAVTIGINSKYYLSSNNRFFTEAVLFYRYWWFNNKYAKFRNIEGYSFSGIRNERQNIYGLKLLMGITVHSNKNSKIKPVIDVYSGAGLRYGTSEFETFEGTVRNIYYCYKKDTEHYWAPSIHIGVRIGIEY